MTKIKALSIQTKVDRKEIPVGEFHGTANGYEVKFVAEGREYLIQTNYGIRSLSHPCTVRVKKDGIQIVIQIVLE